MGILSRVLVIAPLKVCLTTWTTEAQKWAHLTKLKIAFATGGPGERSDAFTTTTNANVVVVNEENVDWLFEQGFHSIFDGIVIDETSRWSQTGGKRFKKIRHQMKNFTWRVGMTAEPVSEDWVRLFGQLLLIDLGKALGRSKDRYLRRYFFATDWERRDWQVLPGKAERIAKKIKPLVFIMPDYKADTLPEKRVTYHRIQLETEAFRRYNRMRIDSVLKVEGETIEAGSRAVLSGKLEQIAAGFSYLNDEDGTGSSSREWITHHLQKRDWASRRACEITAAGESVIIVYWFKAELEALRVMFPNALEINGTPPQIRCAMENWRAEPGKIMLLQPSSASHGVDGLQDTCFRQLWLNPIWSRDRTNQAGDRLWRRGQTRDVEIEVAVAIGTVDEIKIASVENKGEHHELLMKHLGAGSNGLTLAERTEIGENF